jgi:hypothetical protein
MFENAVTPVGYPFQFWVNKIDSHGKSFRGGCARRLYDRHTTGRDEDG